MDAIQESLSQMKTMFAQRMDAFEGRQASKTSSSNDENLAAEFESFKSFVLSSFRALQCQIDIIAQQVEQQEMRVRRKILLIHGLREDAKENTSAAVVKTILEHLKLTGFSEKNISQCHRIGHAVSTDRPRPVLFKLRDEALRVKIWASKTALKGTGITLSEFLTKTRHDVFMAARQQFGVKKCWTRDGSVFVIGSDGSRHRVSCMEDLAKYAPTVASKSPVSAKEAAPSAKAVPARAKRAAAIKK